MRSLCWLLISTGLAAAQDPAATEPSRGRGYVVPEIRGGLYLVTDGAYNTMFLVTSDGVIAVDALPTLGPKQLTAIREVTDKPIRYLVYSHEHTDHIGAATLFPTSATII